MTTIAYRDGVLAADTQESHKDWIDNYQSQKLFSLPDGSIWGGSGLTAGLNKFKEQMEAAAKIKSKRRTPYLPNIKKISVLLIEPSGKVWLYGKGSWEHVRLPYYAIGSGAAYALSAMDVGASAVEAVRVAIKRDLFTGGRVRTLNVGGNDALRQTRHA